MTASDGRPPASDLTRFLRDLSGGDAGAGQTLMPWVVDELRAVAAACLRSQRPGQTLQPTALVNEAYLKLFGRGDSDIRDRKHFFRLAAKAMRQLVIDHARARGRDKRSGDRQRVTLDEAVAQAAEVHFDWLDLDLALHELGGLDERKATVVELRYFAGLEAAEVAEVLDVSKSTIEREWRAARAWLGVRLGEAG